MHPAFPATYSTLCPAALAELISEKYAIENVQCKLLVRGVGDTYLAEAAESRFILRVYRSTHRNLQQIKEETELLLVLKQAGISVSYPIADESGRIIRELEAAEGIRYAVLFSYAPGQTVKALNPQQLYNFGYEMARFHKVSEGMGTDSRWHFDTATTLSRPLELLKTVLADEPETYNWLLKVAKKAAEKLSNADTNAFAKGYCHFDFLPKNVHFEGDAVTFFDFDFMGDGWLVNDIMSFWQHLALDAYTGRTTPEAARNDYSTFLEGYRTVRTISEAELGMVPYLTPGFWLFYMGFHTTHDQFFAFSQPAQVKVFASFLRYVVNAYWNNEDKV
ncbi:phosphotransferase enzyme family protein [Sediminibacterium ginsengisoli]|uniref:Ser/Thr protein kinase RdoA involved in Cpx stress response, MazF antagonist n=1 Tax=Sediminibacterium ginsengisoli TaxID=413434 RepID=A0A1T4QB61_9BACT|nr:phosphotransferase [Sediminibacterium ginsengisoli]SKA00856.1 Ser/Thr protein kinase RdoA involved in Cpx stress response, MazF antagonist [Sediminibacterium ginsengisoli]